MKNIKKSLLAAGFLSVAAFALLLAPKAGAIEQTGLAVGYGSASGYAGLTLKSTENVFYGIASENSSSTAGLILLQSHNGSFKDIFKVDVNGHAGIGTTSNSNYSLTVPGSINAAGFCINGANCISSWPTGTGGDGNWVLNGSNLYASSTSWNVGIGTTNPLYKLTVNHTGSTGVVGTMDFANTNNAYTRLRVLSDGVGFTLSAHSSGIGYISTNSALQFVNNDAANAGSLWLGNGNRLRLTDSTGTNSYFTINNSGNVGIGTTSPATKLDIFGEKNGGYMGYQLAVHDTTAFDGNPQAGIAFSTNVNSSSQIVIGGIAAGKSNTTAGDRSSYLSLFTFQDSGIPPARHLAERMRIDSVGNVGIGTTAPNDRFSIASSGGVPAPSGSSYTGHNYTSTYLSTDDYALVNYGAMQSAISGANSSIINNINSGNYGYWALDSYGSIYNTNSASVGINTSNMGITTAFSVAQGHQGYGTITVNSGDSASTTVWGTNTKFTDAFKVGDIIDSGSEQRTIASIQSDTQLTVSPGFSSAFGPITYYAGSVPPSGIVRFVVKSSGNVGIGVDDPQASLHISSSATNEASPLAILVADASSSGAFSVDRSGKVALGTTSATELLNIGGGKIFLGSTDNAGDVDSRLYNSNGDLYWAGNVIGSASSSPWKLSGTTIVPSSSVWNVAIGSSTEAAEALTLYGRLYLGDMPAPGDTGNRLYSVAGKLFWNGSQLSSATSTWALSGSNIYPSSTSWNVAIGSSNPGSYKLHVTGNSYFDGTVNINGSNALIFNTNGGGWFMSDSTWIRSYGGKSIYQNAGILRTDGSLQVGSGGSTFIATAGGNVGIGKTNPSNPLDVVGRGSFTGSISADTAGGDASGYSFNGSLGKASAAAPEADVDLINLAWFNANAGDLAFVKLSGDTMTGSLNMGAHDITNIANITADKLNVNVIDPLYTIDGADYATFGASFAGGLKEEYTGKADISRKNKAGEYEAVIDFDKVAAGSDIWVWRQVIEFNKDSVEAVISPYGGFASVYYVIDGNKLIFRSDRQAEISYRLTGKRFDWKEWPTKPLKQSGKGILIR